MPDRTQYKLGARPVAPDPRMLLLVNYLDLSALPPIPASHDYTAGLPPTAFPLDGNGQYGDCVEAAQDHLIRLWSTDAGNPQGLTEAQVLQLYGAEAGFDPNNPNSDQGTDPVAAANYWRQTGAFGHRIAAYAVVDLNNLALVNAAIYLFGGLFTAVNLPISAQTQATWDVPAGGPHGSGAPGSWGGHMIVLPSYDAAGNTKAITWAEYIPMTRAFVTTYGAWAAAIISPEWFSGQKSVSGLDVATLQADLAIVSGQAPNPTPTPTWQPDPNLTALYGANATDWAWCRDAYVAAQSAADAQRVGSYASALITADDGWKRYLVGQTKRAGKALPGVPS